MAALENVDRLEWIDLGRSFIPNADIARNVRYPRMHRSQIGQLRPYSEVADSSHSMAL